MNARPERPAGFSSRRRDTPPDPRVVFFRDFLRNPLEVASIIPSSRFLERRVVRQAGLENAKTVVELGPGTGGTTRALLAALPEDARLVVIEINPRFAGLIRSSIDDPRLIVEVGDAADLLEIVARHGLPAPDRVLSGIPFSTMPRSVAMRILTAVRDGLAPGGQFIAYQVRDRVGVLGRQVFGRPEVVTELRNVPPMRIFRWTRSEAAAHDTRESVSQEPRLSR